MKPKQEILLTELLKGETITDACKTAKISRKTYYDWTHDKTFSDELKSRKKAILSDCVAYLRSKFKTASEKLIEIIESDDTSAQVRINAIDSFFRTYKTISEEDCVSRLDEIEQQLKMLKGGTDEETID